MKSKVFVGVLVVILLAIEAIPAPSSPTPGYAIIENELTFTDGICEGTLTMRYALKPLDVVGLLQSVVQDDCSVDLSYVTSPQPTSVAAGSGSGTATTRARWTNEYDEPYALVNSSAVYANGCPAFLGGSHWGAPGGQAAVSSGGSSVCGWKGYYAKWDLTLYPSMPTWYTVAAETHPDAVVNCPTEAHRVDLSSMKMRCSWDAGEEWVEGAPYVMGTVAAGESLVVAVTT